MDSIWSRLRQQDVIVFEDPRRGRRLVLDRYARRACQVPVTEPERDPVGHDSGARDRLEELVRQLQAGSTVQEVVQPEITVICDRLAPSRLALTVQSIVGSMPSARQVRLILHLADQVHPWWQWALPMYEAVGEWMEQQGLEAELRVRVDGCLRWVPGDERVDSIVRNGIGIEYLLSEPPLPGPSPPISRQLEVIGRLADLGLRAPVGIYAHPDNLDKVPGWIDEALVRSRHSGFSIRSIQSHPLYGEQLVCPPCEAAELVALLSECYRAHPYYDDVLDPLASMLERLEGESEITIPQRWLIDRQGRARRYLKLPGWSMEPEPDLKGRANGVPRGELCGDCELRFICAGVDACPPRAGPDAVVVAEAECVAWRFFLEAFVWERLYVAEAVDQAKDPPV